MTRPTVYHHHHDGYTGSEPDVPDYEAEKMSFTIYRSAVVLSVLLALSAGQSCLVDLQNLRRYLHLVENSRTLIPEQENPPEPGTGSSSS